MEVGQAQRQVLEASTAAPSNERLLAPTGPRPGWVALYAATLALGAGLLFTAQPMVARMVLPGLGGAPAVWNGCMAFFQGALLAGYALAHGIARRPRAGLQVGLLAGLIGVAAWTLPIGWSATPPQSALERPVAWLLSGLLVEAAAPALVLGVCSPLLQSWYARLREREAGDPYFLYAASNLGSFSALLAYPFVIERAMDLATQARVWRWAFLAWGALALACGVLMARQANRRAGMADRESVGRNSRDAGGLRWGDFGLWAALAAVPAMLLQGCSLFLTTDLASVPLLWIAPLALYLASYVVAFSPRCSRIVQGSKRAMPFLGIALAYAWVTRSTHPIGAILSLHMAFLFAASVVCHGRLAAMRPAPIHLTGFYFAIALGGFAGGSFSAMAAPALFDTVAEYPLAVALACLALPGWKAAGRARNAGWDWARATDVVCPALMGLGPLALAAWAQAGSAAGDEARWRDAVVFGIPAIACAALKDRPLRFAGALGAYLLAGHFLQSAWSGTLRVERNFFGVARVTEPPGTGMRELYHGHTLHGRQSLDPERRRTPLTYYHPAGPLGSLFHAFRERGAPRQVAVVGLGVGSMAAYATRDEEWTFYEIDPAVIRIARDSGWFTYLQDSAAGRWEVIPGDGRVRLGAAADGSYDLVVLDAFSSDAIPVHLFTREAMALFLRKVKPGGWVAAHISNRYLDLRPVAAALAEAEGWACVAWEDLDVEESSGREPSEWVVIARTWDDLEELWRLGWWREKADKAVQAWSDQRASVVDALEWR